MPVQGRTTARGIGVSEAVEVVTVAGATGCETAFAVRSGSKTWRGLNDERAVGQVERQ